MPHKSLALVVNLQLSSTVRLQKCTVLYVVISNVSCLVEYFITNATIMVLFKTFNVHFHSYIHNEIMCALLLLLGSERMYTLGPVG